MRRLTAWFLLTAGGVACGDSNRQPVPALTPPPRTTPQPAPPTTPERLVRGIVRVDPVPMFRSCDLSVSSAFQDSTVSQIFPSYTLLGASDEGGGLYLIARVAFLPGQNVAIREVELAALPSPTEGCDQPEPDYLVLARGGNPAWRIRVLDDRIEVIRDTARPVILEPIAISDSTGAVVYEASGLDAGERHTLRLVLLPGPCTEERRAVTRFRAEAVIDGTSMTGCAWRGRLP